MQRGRKSVGLTVVRRGLAYAVYADRLLRYDGKGWTQRGEALPASREALAKQVWANADVVAITSDIGVHVLRGDDAPVLQSDLPGVEGGYWAVAGSSARDVWVGSADGRLFRWDGVRWSLAFEVDGAPECRRIQRIWGDDEGLFVTTASRVLRGRSGSFETLLELPCGGETWVGSLWGNSATEVFIALGHTDATQSCGGASTSWFDGDRVRPL